MAKLGASNVRILYDEFDLSGYLNSFGQTVNQENVNVRGFNSLAPERVSDGYDWTWDFGGFGDYDDDAIDDISQHDQDDHYCGWGVGFTAADLWYFGPAKLASRPITGSTGSAIGISMQLSGDEGLSRGVLLDTRTATGTVDATGQNLGATTAGDTFAVQIHVVSGTFSDLDIEIEESSDDGAADAYAAISGMTETNISAPGVYRLTTTAATEAWKRVAVTGFTGTSATFYVLAGVVAD